ncbi:MAG TPA: hypothetical protein VGN88_06255, partial [Phycisphaerae bacterium]
MTAINPNPPTSSTDSLPPRLPKTPPEWMAERWVKLVGRMTGAAGRGLDQLAKVPVVGWVVRRFSSVWFGIILLVLIGAYIAIGSGSPDLRASMEMTDLQFFDAWPMRVLLFCLALDLIIVTLRRIPLTLFKLGSWTVHIGILTLIGGSVWYFSHKEEGSVRIYLKKSVDYSYDVTDRALYSFDVKSDGTFDIDHPTITPIPTLPIYYDHLSDLGNPLDIALQHAIGGSDAQLHVRGYYSCAQLVVNDYRAGAAGETGEGPAISIEIGS